MPEFERASHHGYGRHRRRGRGAFLEALKQNRAAGPIPVIDVGRRLREMRAERDLSIRSLAKNSGLNVNTLSMIENSKASPSLETLQQLAIALEQPITAFFEDVTPKKRIVHYKASQRPSVDFAHGKLEDLGAGIPGRKAETFLVTLDPLSDSGGNYIVHTGHETVFCLEGLLTYTIEDQDFVLEVGDSLSFEAHLPHRWKNTGTTAARSLFMLCPSDEKDRPTERHFAPLDAQVAVR
jgi:transcriptional regulator with XRE-family HTH domain